SRVLHSTATHSLPYFLFTCSNPPRHLLSFPTRRSSDLPSMPAQRGELVAGCRVPNLDHPILAAGGDALAILRERGTDEAVVPAEDRKSTRLNSSHRTISYAVFCLKKKKQLYELRPQDLTDTQHFSAVIPLRQPKKEPRLADRIPVMDVSAAHLLCSPAFNSTHDSP